MTQLKNWIYTTKYANYKALNFKKELYNIQQWLIDEY